jgi:hypothetical protein
MRIKAREMIQRHLIVGTLGSSFVSELVLERPGRSGKTTFFSVLVMMINCDHLAVAAVDGKLLNAKRIELTLTSLLAQVPTLTGHQMTLQKYFEKIVDRNYLPLLPKRFIENPETQAIAKSIIEFGTALSNHGNRPESDSRWV